MEEARREALRRALVAVGDFQRLGVLLGVNKTCLSAWLAGLSVPPQDVFLKAVDLIDEREQLRSAQAKAHGQQGFARRTVGKPP
jgi:hypothetical protein